MKKKHRMKVKKSKNEVIEEAKQSEIDDDTGIETTFTKQLFWKNFC